MSVFLEGTVLLLEGFQIPGKPTCVKKQKQTMEEMDECSLGKPVSVDVKRT